jgi:VCBS repeat-containing protein/parallel beta-helix repeat protein
MSNPTVGRALAAAAATLSMLALAAPASAATRSVCPDGGCDYVTIQAAVDDSDPGDVITVGAGSYVEDVDVTEAVTLTGAGAATTTIRGPAGGGGATVRVSAEGVAVSGFTITRAASAATWDQGLNTAGVAVEGQANSVDVRDCVFTGNRDAIDIADSDGSWIQGNTIDNNRTGLRLSGQTNSTTVKQNLITNNWALGVLFVDGPGADATGSAFSENVITGNWYGGVVDRQTGGGPKDFSADWFGTTTPAVTSADTSEPGYSSLIPVAQGGTATPPGGAPDIAGPASGNFDFTPLLRSGTDTSATFGFQGDFAQLDVHSDGAQTGSPARIDEGVSLAASAGTVRVRSGTYTEDVIVNKQLTLQGAAASSTTVLGPIGGPGATIQAAALGVVIDGFTISRVGNNTTDWNNPGLNSAGVAVVSQASKVEVRNSVLTGNRTAIDVNNSNGNSIHNNVIDFNRAGLIFRNTTDNTTLTENYITNNWTFGLVFLDASGGTDSPAQRAANSDFSNNHLSGNWFAQIVDRQAGGALPPPPNNAKNFSGNWYGTQSPVVTTANSAEPGYAAQVPVAYGGTAAPPGGQPDIAGPASGNFDYTPLLRSGTDTAAGTLGFQGDFSDITVVREGAQTGTVGRVDEGVNRVTSGGTVRTRAGTYAENVTIGRHVHLMGSGDGTVIDPPADGPALSIAASGTAADPLSISDLRTTGAGGTGSTGSGLAVTSAVSDVLISHVSSTDNPGSGLAITSTATVARLRIADSTFASNETGISIANGPTGVAGVRVGGNTFTGNQRAVQVGEAGQSGTGPSGVRVNRNSITGNVSGVVNDSGTTANATCNWWGASDGPSGAGPGSGDSVGAAVDFDPFRTSSDLSGVCQAPVAVADSGSTPEDTPVDGLVLENDTDSESRGLSAVKVTDPAHGAVTLSARGAYTYTPAADYSGPDSFTYKANDGASDSNTVAVSISVTAVNDVPVAVGDSGSVAEDGVLTGTSVLGNDSDVEDSPLTAVKVTEPSHGAVTLNSNGTYTYTPAADYNGPDSFTYKANDGTADSTLAATVSINVTAVNDAPAAAGDSGSVAEDGTLNGVSVLGNDSDVENSPLTAVKVTDPAHGTVTLSSNGTYTYSPAANYNGPDSFTYKANDGTGDSNVVTVSITVNAVPDLPVAVDDSASVAEDGTLNVAAADAVLKNDSDADGQSLTAVKVTDPSHGTVTLSSNGSYTYTPVANYNGSDSFTYKANDGTSDSNTVAVSISVTAVNDAPVAVGDSGSAAEDGVLNVAAADGVLKNDTDVEGQTLHAAKVTDPAHGTVTVDPTGSYVYTPAANYNGPDSFTYKASDGAADSNVATVSITVGGANDAPEAVGDSATVAEDDVLNGSSVLPNDTDTDGDPLTAAKASDPTHGTATVNADGTYTYTPAANYNGSDSFTYRANDRTSDSGAATVSITVTPVNDAPTAADDSATVDEDGVLSAAASGVLGNDHDVEGQALSATKVSDPAHGTVTLASNGSYEYSPAADYNGPDSFTYRAADGTAESGVATVSISVSPVAETPGPELEDTLAPVFLRAKLTSKAFTVRNGTTFVYSLSEQARVLFTIEKRKEGKKARYSLVGRFGQNGKLGVNRKKFSGKIGRKTLQKGRYRASLKATDASGNVSVVKHLSFKVVRR